MKWFRSELHCHTIASDGDMLAHELVENARVRKCEIIGVTDHNTVTSCQDAIKAAKGMQMTVIPGIEWTTFWGHIVVLGGNSDVDWRTITFTNIEEKMQRAEELGDVVIIAHPKRLGSPFCSECRFTFDVKDYSSVKGYEVWSHYHPSTKVESKMAKEEWTSLLQQGYKIAPVYGYDWHTRDEGCPEFAFTYIGIESEKPTQEEVLEAILNGKTYIATGIDMNIALNNNEFEYHPGDEIKRGKYSLQISAKVAKDYAKYYSCNLKGLRLYKNEKVFYAKKWEGEEIEIPVSLIEKGTFRIELYGSIEGKEGDLAIVSPYYIV